MSKFAEIGQLGIIAIAELALGIVSGAAIDAVFPDATPDAPFLLQAVETVTETALMGIMIATMAQSIVPQINPDNVTGGFPFFIGLQAGMGQHRIKLETAVAKIKLRVMKKTGDISGWLPASDTKPAVLEKAE